MEYLECLGIWGIKGELVRASVIPPGSFRLAYRGSQTRSGFIVRRDDISSSENP